MTPTELAILINGTQKNLLEDYGLSAPTYLLTDYIEIVYLPVSIFVGTFLNVLVFKKLCWQWNRQRTDSLIGQRRSYMLLKFNLTIADLMVLLIYASGRFCWVSAYQWLGGEILCKAYQFVSLTAFHLTAFVMVTIALDRLRAVYSPVLLRHNNKSTTSKMSTPFVRNMLIISWLLAALASSGQICVWKLYTPPFRHQENFVQCTTIWEIRKVHNNTLDTESLGESGGLAEATYTMIHLLSTFWVPVLIIGVCYTLICVRYVNHMLNMASRFHHHVTDGVTMSLRGNRNNNPTNYNSSNCSSLISADRQQFVIALESPSSSSLCNRNIRVQQQTTTLRKHLAGTSQQGGSAHRRQQRVFRSSGLVVLCYVACWLPYNILGLWKLVDSQWYAKFGEEFNILNALIVLNSVFNPLIYGFD